MKGQQALLIWFLIWVYCHGTWKYPSITPAGTLFCYTPRGPQLYDETDRWAVHFYVRKGLANCKLGPFYFQLCRSQNNVTTQHQLPFFMEGAASMERLEHALMEKWSGRHLQKPALICTEKTLATLTGKNYQHEGKRSCVIQVLCVSAMEKKETFFSSLPEFFSLGLSTAWASESWSNLVHVMRFTQLDCQHKQGRANQKRWKIWHIIKAYLQIYLELFLPHWQIIMHQLSYWVDQDTSVIHEQFH